MHEVPEKYKWVEIKRRASLPLIGWRVLFESKSGFRFYGVLENLEEARMLLYDRVVPVSCLKKWAHDRRD